MKFILSEEEIKNALQQYLQDYQNDIFKYKELSIDFHQSGFKLEHPLIANITFKEATTEATT